MPGNCRCCWIRRARTDGIIRVLGYHYILGFVYFHKRQWDKAIPEFEMAIAREPANAEFLRGLGWVKCRRGNRTEGLALLHKANHLAPDNVNILTDLAVAYLSADIDQARKFAERAVAIDPGSVIAKEVLGSIQSADKYVKQTMKGTHSGLSRFLPDYSNTMGIYRFKVSSKDKPNIWRVIEIKENQMLSSLHKAIYRAFDRFGEHQYSFYR